ncbi:MAG: hypothetical protein WKF77_03685 [Planctomycetaceae bacterium]
MPCLLRILTVLLLFPVTSLIAEDSKTSDSIIQRETRELNGWTVHVNKELLKKEPKATEIALNLLGKQLAEIVRVVPKPALAELRKVPLYFSPEYADTNGSAEFHPGAEWLKEHGRDAVMVKGVEFSNILNFEQETRRMPNFALHELAHAYHNLVLKEGFGNPQIIATFERAKEGGRYDKVERWHGVVDQNTFERAYAITNPMEYFAETTEAYFTRNDFFPFNSGELKAHDPEMFDLLTELLGVKEPNPKP